MQRHHATVLARTLVLRVVEQRARREALLRTAAVPGWKRLHTAADSHRPALALHVQRAFLAAKRSLAPVIPGDHMGLEVRMDQALRVLKKNLTDGLVPLLLQTLQAGGQAAAKNLVQSHLLRTAGDVEGHEFHGNQWTGGVAGVDPKDKDTWYRDGGDWQVARDGERPYGWTKDKGADYEPPEVTHTVFRSPDAAIWGYSHGGSSTVTGEAAKQMGLSGWRDLHGTEEAQRLSSQMLGAIHNDKAGSEEPLYHAFENTRGTTFKEGDTFDLPLAASSGRPETLYAQRSAFEYQTGPPTVIAFSKGTPMVGYGTIRKRDLEDYGQPTLHDAYKERGHVWDEAIVAGRFRVDKVETKYMGSQHFARGYYKPGEPTKQLYGHVVHVTPTHTFDPDTKSWVPRG